MSSQKRSKGLKIIIMDYSEYTDLEMQKAMIFSRCAYEDEITKEEALSIFETKFWETPVWTPLELSYMQFKQERMIMSHETWLDVTQKIFPDRELFVWFYMSANIRAAVIDIYETVHNSDRLYHIHINHFEPGESDITIQDLLYATGSYVGKSDADAALRFDFNVLKITGGTATPCMLGGNNIFYSNWKLALDTCNVYYTVYLDQKYYELMKSR